MGICGAAAAVLAAAAYINAQVPMVHWQWAGKIPASGGAAKALALDPRSQALYVGVQRGLFISRDGGAHWQPLEAEGVQMPATALAFDANQSVLFGSDGQQLFRLDGEHWRIFTVSAADNTRVLSAEGRRAIWGLAVDARRNRLYLGSLLEILRSSDGGETWEWEGSLPAEGRALAVDERQGDVYVAASGTNAFYRSRDGGRTWFSLAQDSTAVPLSYLAEWGRWGGMGRWIDGSLIWAAEDVQGVWMLPQALVDARNCVVRPLPGSKAELICAWGLVLMRAGIQAMPLPWLAMRLWSWQGVAWLSANVVVVLAGLGLSFGLIAAGALISTYQKVSRPWGVPPLVAWLAPARAAAYARAGTLEKAWPVWERRVRAELARFDDVVPWDLEDIPAPFRRYALEKYAGLNARQECLEVRPQGLSLQRGAGAPRWREAGQWMPNDRHDPEGRAGRVADARAKVLAEALGVSVGESQVLADARVYLGEGVELPQGVPAHLQIVLLDAVWAGIQTAEALADALRRSPEDFALLVLAEGDREAAGLHQAMTYLLSARNYVVLDQDGLYRLLVAREPRQALAEIILRPAAYWGEEQA